MIRGSPSGREPGDLAWENARDRDATAGELVGADRAGGSDMQLMRIGAPGAETPVARIDDTTYVDVSDVVGDFDERFFDQSAFPGGMDRLRGIVDVRCAAGRIVHFAEERIGAPIARPHQILCIAENYRDHAAGAGRPVAAEPVLFTKSPNTLVGPNDVVRMPRGSTKLAAAVELGIVIGRRTSYLDDADAARAAIAGYLICNDVTEHGFRSGPGGRWSTGTSAETFNPAGPWLLTPDRIADVRDLGLWLDVNGVRRQSGSTAAMVFDPYTIVHRLSQFLVLEAGDLINTGTPPGAGPSPDPSVFLQPGDVIELGIDGLGGQRQTVVAPR
jgi:2,4-diketo-3-deoxy-L-fuconate hydrolase